MEFKDRLKKARNEAELTQLELANKCGKRREWVASYECGLDNNPTMDSIRLILKALKNIDANYLFK